VSKKKPSIFDDLSAVATGESLDSASGAFVEGDRVVVRKTHVDVMNRSAAPLPIRKRFGTVDHIQDDFGESFVTVDHDYGKQRVYNSIDLILFYDWIKTSETADANCQHCYDTGFSMFEPGGSDCSACVGKFVDYQRSVDAWRDARKKRE
jgi:hypothetical protein